MPPKTPNPEAINAGTADAGNFDWKAYRLSNDREVVGAKLDGPAFLLDGADLREVDKGGFLFEDPATGQRWLATEDDLDEAEQIGDAHVSETGRVFIENAEPKPGPGGATPFADHSQGERLAPSEEVEAKEEGDGEPAPPSLTTTPEPQASSTPGTPEPQRSSTADVPSPTDKSTNDPRNEGEETPMPPDADDDSTTSPEDEDRAEELQKLAEEGKDTATTGGDGSRTGGMDPAEVNPAHPEAGDTGPLIGGKQEHEA